ncbi:MAG: pirin family protein, partial [Bacteroidia bacterium]|nr:pirin family protein [Bacteroidia bacterium]
MDNQLPRRSFLGKLSLAIGGGMVLPLSNMAQSFKEVFQNKRMNPIIGIKPLGFQWETLDPFLFCVHHEDHFPKGN